MKSKQKQTKIKSRLEYLRGELRKERISQGELCELTALVPHIAPGDVELLEAAGVPETDQEPEQHTPGPWETVFDVYGNWDVCAAGGGDMIADLKNCAGNTKANARLIAAAPELLAAVKIAEVTIRRLAKTDSANGTLDVIRAAIAKAVQS